MSKNYSGIGGSFTIDPSTGEVAPTIAVADEKEIAYSAPVKENQTEESNDGTANT